MMDDADMKFGLLMESAQAHQRLAETHLEKLRAHTQDLDGVVRDEIRRTLTEELHMLSRESARCAQALRRSRHGAGVRTALWSLAIAVLCTAAPLGIMSYALPSEKEIAALRVRRDELSAAVGALQRRGGGVDWRHCGEAGRLCVRVDRKAPAYGEKADFYVVAGQ